MYTWTTTKDGDDDRLFGGGSGDGGLARVGGGWPGPRDGRLGFRLLIISSKYLEKELGTLNLENLETKIDKILTVLEKHFKE